MLKRINFFSVCLIFGISVFLILAGSRYTDNTVYQLTPESRRNIRNFNKVKDVDLLQSYSVEDDDTPFTEDVIYKRTRLKIKLDLANYNFSRTRNEDKLDGLLMEVGGQPMRNVIISTWRSGTTFLGEVLNSVPGNYYHYEPLLSLGIVQIRGPPLADKALYIIKKLMKCNHEDMEFYFEHGKKNLHQFSHNTRLWDNCKLHRSLCFDSVFTSKFCELFPFQSMKLVRLRLRLMEELLQDIKLRVKVVYLIRDPRGVMQSRQHRDFCQPSPDCWQPELLCADMVNDYVAAGRFLKKYPHKFTVMRYEDLALNPNNSSRSLLQFLGLSVTPSVEDFLETHTNVHSGGVSSTFRVSREVPFKWRSVLNYSYVEQIQSECKEAMLHWGYTIAQNASHLESKTFNPITDYGFD